MISKSVLRVILKSLLILSIIKYVKGNKAGDPIFLGEIQNQTVSGGGNVKFACQVDNLGSYKVAWINYEKSAILTVANHVITRNQRITVSHDEHQKTWYLHISEARETDSGKYVCQINTDSAMTISGYLTVVVPPAIVDHESTGDVIAQEGSDVQLRCKATGSPKPIVTWKREDNKVIYVDRSTKLKEVISEVLTLRKVSRLNMGAYLCIASNGHPPTVSKRILVTVNFLPMVWSHNQLIGVYIGYTLTLECFIEAHPTSLNYWTKEDGGMIYDSEKYKIENRTGNPEYKIHMLLTVRHLEEEDFGTYRCVARNSIGEADGSIKVYKIDPPSTTTEIPNAKENVDGKNEIDPPATTTEIPNAKENVDEKNGNYSDSYEKSSFGNELKIFGGTYGRRYANDLASYEESLYGNRLKLPRITYEKSYVNPTIWIPHEIIGASIGSTVTLDCFTEVHSTSRNYWTREDGDMIYDSDKYKIESRWEDSVYNFHMLLTVHHLEEEDFGTYRCVAKNPRGETDGSIKVYKIDPPSTTTEIPNPKENKDEKNENTAKKRPDALTTNEVEAGFKFLFRLPIFKFLCEVLA